MNATHIDDTPSAIHLVTVHLNSDGDFTSFIGTKAIAPDKGLLEALDRASSAIICAQKVVRMRQQGRERVARFVQNLALTSRKP